MEIRGITVTLINKTEVGKDLFNAPIYEEREQAVVNRLGDGYAADPYVGKNRANVSIHPETAKAFRETYKENSILKALR